MILILFTASFPYASGGEQNFIEAELPYLTDAFERVVLVPERRAAAGSKLDRRVEVEDGYSERLQSAGQLRTFVAGLFSAQAYQEVLSKPWLLLRPAFLKRLLFFAGQAELTRDWLIGWIRQQGLDPEKCLCYTYWFDQAALGIGLAKRTLPGLKSVSRVHRYDLYEELRVPPYWPCRETALAHVDRLFAVSEAGTEYLRGKYPQFASKICTARLGVPDPGSITQPSRDGKFRIVSCSRVLPVKRLDLMLDGIEAAALRRPSLLIEWGHFGTGPLGKLEDRLRMLPANLQVDLAAYSTRADLFRYYREQPVDAFINVSSSEGTPVSIMEAISCGIPVVATSVGGNVEVVTARNGFLIAENPTPDQIADALLATWDNPGQLRAGSRELWSEKYNAARNYSDFVRTLTENRR